MQQCPETCYRTPAGAIQRRYGGAVVRVDTADPP